MTEKTKITLSDKEFELVCNTEWILTKHSIIEKVYRLFGSLALSMQQRLLHHAAALPEAASETTPKISRGENYRSLPYVMLDYPRHFTKGSSMAIRTLFWWGNFFSINLHLSGSFKAQAIPALKANFIRLQNKGYWLCTHTDPWQHHFEEDNYTPLLNYTEAEFATMLYGMPFIKIAKKIPLSQWDMAEEFLKQHFDEMIHLLETNYPNGEKGLSPGIPITGFDL